MVDARDPAQPVLRDVDQTLDEEGRFRAPGTAIGVDRHRVGERAADVDGDGRDIVDATLCRRGRDDRCARAVAREIGAEIGDREDADGPLFTWDELADCADIVVKIRRERTPPKSAWDEVAKTYERALEQIRGALGLSDIDEHETVMSEIVRLKRLEKNAYAAPPWQLPSNIPTATVPTLIPPGQVHWDQPPQGGPT